MVKRAPVIGGINGTDPFRHWPHYLTELRNHGVSGVLNWPSVGLIDGIFRENLEGSGLSLQREVEVVNLAHEGPADGPLGLRPRDNPANGRSRRGYHRHAHGADGVRIRWRSEGAYPRGCQRCPGDRRRRQGRESGDPGVRPWRTDLDPEWTEYVLHKTTGVEGFLGGSAPSARFLSLAHNEQIGLPRDRHRKTEFVDGRREFQIPQPVFGHWPLP